MPQLHGHCSCLRVDKGHRVTKLDVRAVLYLRAVQWLSGRSDAGSIIGLVEVPSVQLVAHVWARPVLLVAADVREAAQSHE